MFRRSWRLISIIVFVTAFALGIGGLSQGQIRTITLAEGGTSASSIVMDPDIATDGKKIYATYSEKVDIIVRSSNDGQTFSAPVNVSNSSGVSIQPSIGAAGDGIVCVAWMEKGDAAYEIFAALSKDGGATFTKPANVSNNETESGVSFLNAFDGSSWDGNVSATCDAKGNVYVAWADDQKMLFSSSTDGGATFSKPAEVNSGGTEIRYPDLTTDGTVLYLAWANAAAQNSDVNLSTSADAGATWSAPVNVTSNGGFSDAPSVAVDGAKVYVCNDDTTGTNNADIFCATSNDGGKTFGSSSSAAKDGGFVDVAAVPGKGFAFAYDGLTPQGRSVGVRAVSLGQPLQLPETGAHIAVNFEGNANISRDRIIVLPSGIYIIVPARGGTGTQIIIICIPL
jgi:hypothetical protein